MEKRYQIELDRNERDYATFFKRRDVSLSQNKLRVLIASRSRTDKGSMFDSETFLKKLIGHKLLPYKLFNKTRSTNIKT
jgi:hypothetical protein